ncbi:phenylalanine--tRNA ligase subunit beta [Chitiniphilus purpureus]|uniref:Phenylalanine--tRNA ligase beta subunit n=1 Tax=Chitiniphilus purpureus TaxID=2981137 RepID=A0ABY6DKC6_9NEIS|nr:phenylalanine--tRNA ligase subunit beta [Chitiniphilus sp. CD1]UXY14787.1 phenylalanine--tRNA ligase subunit beta [Chitiniphilus sp. CD1]
MKFSEQWLRSWVNPALTSDELSHLLTMAGLEVEEQEPAAPAFDNVFVAEVLSVVKHPDADRLNVCSVNVGEAEPLQIVCGAPNVAAGLKVPCARIGAALPGDFKIKRAKVRGVESSGMLCSGDELGIPDGVDGLLVLPASAPVGTPLRDYLQLDDQLFTLKLTPNRADCLSIKGIAREVAALTGSQVNAVPVDAVAPAVDVQRAVVLEAQSACSRYAGRVIRGVNPAARTPDWLRQRLQRSGLRAISPIVDVTNYVLLELGQPLHAFDHGKLDGRITVRVAKPGEQLTLLNEKALALQEDMLVIADATGPVALAGIMGGLASAVDDTTRDVFLESAYFAPEAIAGRARRLGFSSDASHRYERGVDFNGCRDALERATALILDICGGEPGPVTEALAPLPARPAVSLRVARVARVLGLTLPVDEIVAILTRLGLVAEPAGEVIHVTPPSYRFDIQIEEDLIEEIARAHGYDRIPVGTSLARTPMLPQPGQVRPKLALKHILVGRDYQEAVSYAFVEARWEADFAGNNAPIRLLNPIASQMSVMRSTLLGGLIHSLKHNQNRKQERVRLFELARVFHGKAAQQQPERLAGVAWGAREPEQWGAGRERVDFYDVKADVAALLAPREARFVAITGHPALHPGRAAAVLLNDTQIGVLGELHPKWVQAYELGSAPIVFELDVAVLTTVDRTVVVPVSRLQPVRRDLALIVDETRPADEVLAVLRQAASGPVTEIALFDVYRGKGVPEQKKSLAFKVLMQDTHKTLTDEEVDAAVAKLIRQAEAAGATLRV